MSKKTIGGSFNHDQNIIQLLEAPMAGGNWLRAFAELSSNANDAGGKKMVIEFKNYEGVPAIFISDDGTGLDEAGLTSYLSYGYSSRKREDIKTVGTNGTGGKFLLALGDVNKTSMTTISVNQVTGITKIVINKDYLLALASGVPVDACTILKKIPVEFSPWQRGTGFTVILTGYDTKRVNAISLAEGLAEFISPRALEKIEIFQEGKQIPITQLEQRGNPYDFSEETTQCGLIEMNLYYGGQADGPKICGLFNQVMDFSSFASRLTVEQRKQISHRIWANIGGHIYIPFINLWRTHDGSLSQDFYREGGPCDEVVQILGVVVEELRELSEAKRQQAQEAAGLKLANYFSNVTKLLHPDLKTSIPSSGVPKKAPSIKEGIYVLPGKIFLEEGGSLRVLLQNKGDEYVSFLNSTWTSANPEVAIPVKPTGPRATIFAGKAGKTVITITNDTGHTHSVKVEVCPGEKTKKPYIFGPGIVLANESTEYKLAQFKEDSNLVWSIDSDLWQLVSSGKEAIVIPVGASGDTAILSVKAGDTVVATRKLQIDVPESTSGTKSVPVIVIGGQAFELLITSARQDSASIMAEWFSELGYPVIAINPLHKIYNKFGGLGLSADSMLTSLASAGTGYLLSIGKLSLSEKGAVYDDFILTFKTQLSNLSNQKDKVNALPEKRKKVDTVEVDMADEKRGRGRPRKEDVTPQVVVEKRRLGRPRKED